MAAKASKSTPSKRSRVAKKPKARGPAATRLTDARWSLEYLKYFTAPAATPQAFHVFDLTDGASVTTSSHT